MIKYFKVILYLRHPTPTTIDVSGAQKAIVQKKLLQQTIQLLLLFDFY